MATGAGKTATATHIAAGVAAKRKRVLILAHRRELLDQLSGALGKWRVKHSIIDAERIGIPRTDVVVGSVFTVFRRMKHMPQYDLIIMDEAHHCSGTNTFSRVMEHFPKAFHLGITATPARHTQEPLSDSFDTMVHGPSTAELINMGYLCPPQIYAPSAPDLSGLHHRGGDFITSEIDAKMNKPTITGDSIKHYQKLAAGKRAIAFCCTVAHAEAVAAQFRAAGIAAASVDGKMDPYTRSARLKDFEAGKVPVITSVNLISEGFDCPAAEVGIMLRPTESMPLYIQMVGRLLRTYPGKKSAIILDHAGLTLRHDLPDAPRTWSLDGVTKPATESVPRIVVCQKCYACHSGGDCPRCGHVNAVKERKLRQVDGELGLVGDPTAYDVQETSDPQADVRRQYYILKALAKQRAYENPEAWAFKIVSARLADRLHKQGAETAGPIEELEQQTIVRDRVMTAMKNEGDVTG
jgi:DNA repair protein RadD